MVFLMGFIMTFGVALCNLYISFISLKNRAKVHIIKHITKIIFRQCFLPRIGPQKSVCLDDNCMRSGVGCGRGLFGYFD